MIENKHVHVHPWEKFDSLKIAEQENFSHKTFNKEFPNLQYTSA